MITRHKLHQIILKRNENENIISFLYHTSIIGIVAVKCRYNSLRNFWRFIIQELLHTISFTDKWPVAKTMALGGVATGSMKAKEAAITQGNIKYKGFKLSRRAWNRKLDIYLFMKK